MKDIKDINTPMSRKMSRFVCDICGSELATKNSLQRHKYSNRCKNLASVNTLHTCDENPQKAEDPTTPLINKVLDEQRSRENYTMFKHNLSRCLTTYSKRYSVLENQDGIILINNQNVPGYFVRNIILKGISYKSEKQRLQFYFNDVKLFDHPLDFIAEINVSDPASSAVNIHRLIFGNQYIPLDEIKIVITENTDKLSIEVESYIVTEKEQKRFRQQKVLEYYCFGWFQTNIVDNDRLNDLLKPTEMYVSDIYYKDKEAINPNYRVWGNYRMHYHTTIDENDRGWNYTINESMIASLIPPGNILFNKTTEDPVTVRYLTMLTVSNGKTYCYHDLYNATDPIEKAKAEIKERIDKINTGLPYEPLPNEYKVYGNEGYMIDINFPEHSIKVKIPTQWSRDPFYAQQRYLLQPDWDKLGQQSPRAILSLDNIVKTCLEGTDVKNHKFINDTFCFRTSNDKWYGFTKEYYELYKSKAAVPVHRELFNQLMMVSWSVDNKIIDP